MSCPSCSSASPVIFAGDGGSRMHVLHDGRTVTGSKGYSLIRASRGISRGVWYVELRINPPDSAGSLDVTIPHVRVGWATSLSDVDGPVGSDHYSFSYADRTGNKFYQSEGHTYGPTYGHIYTQSPSSTTLS